MLTLHALSRSLSTFSKAGLLAVSCSVGLASCDAAFGFNPLDYRRHASDLEAAWRRTASFRYLKEAGDEWKSPKEFERDGGGDCEDFAAYLMYCLGEGSELCVVRLDGRDGYHAIVAWDGRFLEPQSYGTFYEPSEFEVAYSLSYGLAMQYATLGGSKGLVGGGGT